MFHKSILTKILNYEVGRFLIIGITTVIIDLVIYLILLNIIFETSISQSISKTSINGFFRFCIFILLYLSTLFVNVASNEIILNLMNQNILSILIAFIIATSFSAGLNFLGMKYIVFLPSKI